MPPPVATQERRRISPRYSALQKPWVVAPQINNPSHDASTVQISRRDFLKASGAALGGLALAAMFPGIVSAKEGQQPQHSGEFVFSLRQRLSVESQEFLFNHNIRTVSYEGRTISIDDPTLADDYALAGHFDAILGNLRSIELSGQKPQTISGYRGDVTPATIRNNFDRVSFLINKTDKQEYLTQTFIGKADGNNLPETEPWNWFELRKSLMVSKQGLEHKSAWFDNVRSGGFASGKDSQVVVNAEKGTVFQLTFDKQNIVQTAFSGLKGSVSVERLKDDFSSLETSFLPTTPAFVVILKGLRDLFNNRGVLGSVTGNIDTLFEQVFSPRATVESRMAFFRGIGMSEQDFIDNSLGPLNTLYSADFPTNMNMALQLMGAYRNILELVQNPHIADNYISEAKNNHLLFSSLIPSEPIPTAMDDAGQKLRDVTNSILQKEILLPHSIPQMHILQMKNTYDPTKVKQVLVARYSANDTSTLNSFATTVMPGTNVEFITDVSSADPMDIFNHGWLNNYDKDALQLRTRTVNSAQYATGNPSTWSTDNRLSGWSVDQTVPAVEIRKEYVRLYYDPAAHQSRLFAGIELPQRDGTGKIIELRPGSMKGKNYTQRQQSSNRTVWFTGDYPYSIHDVTEKVIELRKKGFTTASQFGFISPPEAAEMVYGLAQSVDYTKLEQFLGEQRNALLQYSDPAGIFDKAHSILLAHKPTSCTRYTMQEKSSFFGFIKTKEYVPSGNQAVDKNTLLRAYELMTINGKKMVVVAKNPNDGSIYAVPESEMQFVGVDSDMLIDLQKALIAAALVFGGYKIYSVPGVSNALSSLTKTLVKAVIK